MSGRAPLSPWSGVTFSLKGVTCAVFLFNAPSLAAQVRVRADFSGANLLTWVERKTNEFDITLRKDNGEHPYQWYLFGIEAPVGEKLTFHIVGAGASAAPNAWQFALPVVSHDGGASWERVTDTQYADGIYRFSLFTQAEQELIAYNPVYGLQRWLWFVDSISVHPRVRAVQEIGKSINGNPLHMLWISDPRTESMHALPTVWIIARQHPAEVGGSWMLEGFLGWLLGNDPSAGRFLERASVVVVGFMNPDGVERGNYRTNAQGADLLTSWFAADSQVVPTVAAVKNQMYLFAESDGVIRLFLDLHSHSTIRANFSFVLNPHVAGDELHTRTLAFLKELGQLNDDFSRDLSAAGIMGVGAIASGWAFREFGASAVVVESSYQDLDAMGRCGEYMTVRRLNALGRDIGRAVASVYFGVQLVTEEPRGQSLSATEEILLLAC